MIKGKKIKGAMLAVLAINFIILPSFADDSPKKLIALITDFGIADGSIGIMKGIIKSVSDKIDIQDITHEIEPFNIQQAAYALTSNISYWPVGTVFVSIVDSGAGIDTIKPVVARTKGGYFFVTPNNGTLTYVDNEYTIEEVRSINKDEYTKIAPGNRESSSFYGRDMYSFIAAKLAIGEMSMDQIGSPLRNSVVKFPVPMAEVTNNTIVGKVLAVDRTYGNIYTNIDIKMLSDISGVSQDEFYRVQVSSGNKLLFEDNVPFRKSYGDVPPGEPLLYGNRLDKVAIALNKGSFLKKYNAQTEDAVTLFAPPQQKITKGGGQQTKQTAQPPAQQPAEAADANSKTKVATTNP